MVQIRFASSMAAYFCMADPFGLSHGRSAWRIGHPDIPDEINCHECGSPCVLGSTQHPLDLEFCFEEYLGQYNYEKDHPESRQYLTKYRLLERKDVVKFSFNMIYETQPDGSEIGHWEFKVHSHPLLLLDKARAEDPTNEKLNPINL